MPKKTKLRAILRNETRWSSTYEKFERYFEIKHFLGTNDTDTAILLPSAEENILLSMLLQVLKDLNQLAKNTGGQLYQARGANILMHFVFSVKVVHSRVFETALRKY